MIELISAAKVVKNLEIDVSLPEKVVSNQEKCQVPWQIGTCMPGTCPLTDATSLHRRAEIWIIVSSKSKSTCYIVELLIFELFLLLILFCFHSCNVYNQYNRNLLMGYYTIQKGFVFRQRFPYEYTACYIVELLIVELFLLLVFFFFHNCNV